MNEMKQYTDFAPIKHTADCELLLGYPMCLCLNPSLQAETKAKLSEESWHFKRTCLHCGYVWGGLHCPHDGYQNPCPHCEKRPDCIDSECKCEFDWPEED